MMDTLLPIIFFISGMAGLAISVIIICKKENFKQNLFLSLCLFALSISCIYSFYLSHGKWHEYPKTVSILKSLTFIVAPCAFLYIKKTIYPHKKMKVYDWLNFIPLALHIAYMALNRSLPIVSDFWLSNNLFFNIDFFSFNVLLTLMWLMYAYTQNLVLLNIESKKSLSISGNYKAVNWLKTFSMLIMLLFISIFLQRISTLTFINLALANNIVTSFILVLSGYVLIFRPALLFGAADSDEYTLCENENTNEAEECSNIHKLPAIGIPEDKLEEYTLILNDTLAKEEPFLKSGFVIRDLAEMTGIPVHHLSLVINTKYNLHFQDFVNRQRIDYLKARINNKEWKNLSLEGLAWAVGFKSRTTFFRAFIKLTGQSPSDYLNAQKKKKTYTATA